MPSPRPLFTVLLFCALAIAACGPKAAQPPGPLAATAAPTSAPPKLDELDRPLPLDTRIKHGKFDNGLTYYVLPHKKPEKRAHFWLVVDAGSVLEDDDQRGLAHFVEHMGFNGTRRFPKQDLINFLENVGVRFGADLNAYTSFDETVYMLQVPSDRQDLVDKGLSVLRDWADGMSFDPDEVEKERGVVLEEWRLGRGARMRLFDKQAPVLFHGSKYAERITIGKPEIIRAASRDTLVRYYRDWYRPDLMAVVAVGDFAGEDIERRIRAEFGSLPAAAKPRPRPAVTLPAHAQTLVSIETDPEMPATSVAILSKVPHRPELSARDYRRMLAERLFHSMVNTRLDEIRRKPDSPFLFASSSSGDFVRSSDVYRQTAGVKEDAVEPGFAALLEEVLRVQRHGFIKSELERAKQDVLRLFQQAVIRRETRDSREFAQEIVRNFLEDEAMPGSEAELALAEKLLPGLALEELNNLAKSFAGASRVITVSGPTKMKKPTADSMLAIVKNLESRQVAAYEDAVAGAPLMATPPKPGSIAATSTIAEIGVTEWKLANGVRVIVKPTDFDKDDVRVSAFSPGGHSLVKDADYDSARFADSVVAQGGLGGLDAVKLRKSLSGKIASVNARIGELDEGLSGRASHADLELLFQLIHLTFTAPRKDENAFVSWRARETESAKNRRLSPEASFYEDMMLLSWQNHRRRQPTTPEALGKIEIDKALAIYKNRFADASDFTFVFVGNVELERLKPLVETYLGSLPSSRRKETFRDVRAFWTKGIKTKTILMGNEPKSTVMLAFHGTEKWSRDTENDMRMLSEVVRIRLREVLREDMGGVYGVRAGGAISRRPRQEYTFSVGFGCSPENVERLKQAVFDEIKAIRERGIGEEYLVKVKASRRRAHETDLKENSFWERELVRAYTYADDPRLIPDITPMLEKISSDRVQAAAKKYLTGKEYVLGILNPQSSPSSSAGSAAVP
jgi:zinc protease